MLLCYLSLFAGIVIGKHGLLGREQIQCRQPDVWHEVSYGGVPKRLAEIY
jgi:hypothetical protein